MWEDPIIYWILWDNDQGNSGLYCFSNVTQNIFQMFCVPMFSHDFLFSHVVPMFPLGFHPQSQWLREPLAISGTALLDLIAATRLANGEALGAASYPLVN